MGINELRKMSIERLCDIWEMTTNINSNGTPIIRGWIMDAIEEKNPEGFNAWLDSSDNEDTDLRKYVLA